MFYTSTACYVIFCVYDWQLSFPYMYFLSSNYILIVVFRFEQIKPLASYLTKSDWPSRLTANLFRFLANCGTRTGKNDQADRKIIIQCDKQQDTTSGRHFSHTCLPSAVLPKSQGCQLASTLRTCASDIIAEIMTDVQLLDRDRCKG